MSRKTTQFQQVYAVQKELYRVRALLTTGQVDQAKTAIELAIAGVEQHRMGIFQPKKLTD